MRDKTVRCFYRFFYWLVPLWYGLTMFFTRFRRHPPVMRYANTREIVNAIRWGYGWKPDPLKGNFDVMMDPRRFQRRLDRSESNFGDCDDHAIYWCTALLESKLASRAWIGTVWYAKRGEKGEGHVVCIYQHGNVRYWCDYRDPKVTPTKWEWALDVAQGYGAQAIAAGMVEVTLRKNGAPKFRFLRGITRTLL